MENITKLLENLDKNNIKGFYVEKKEDVFPLLDKLINEGDIVGFGGSMTLEETGVMSYLRSGRFNLLDRDEPGLTRAEVEEIYRKIPYADAFLCSSNAVTMDGVLYNVDGFANRVSSILHGPKSVIMVVGVNKIVENLDEAVLRVKTIAAPRNAQRLNKDTYCKTKGKCISLLKENPQMCDGCNSEDRICCDYVISAYQRIKERIKVIIVGENLGY